MTMEESVLVDYREIAGKYTFGEHAARANQYFAKINVDSVVARKPFASPLEVPEIVSGISTVVAGLNLFHGARVLDFGAGTCWVSRFLALMGCEVTAADVSANALKVGRELITSDPVAKHLRVSFAVLEELKLPFEDGSFDRIVVFDAFHHCPEQLPMIGEFHRVLRDGGIIAFHEPGPNHSRHPQSQYEMRHFDVIEGDIVVEELFSEAQRVGFGRAQLAAYAVTPTLMDVDQYNAFLAGEGDTGQALAEQIRQECMNRRVFFLHKGGDAAYDSRRALGLQAELDLSVDITPDNLVLSGRIVNTGPGTWLPSGGETGSVNLGAHLKAQGGYNHDYVRLPVSSVQVPHGAVSDISATIPFPDMDRFRLAFDLVSEGVTWFELYGTKLAEFEIDRAAGTVVRIA